MGQRENGARRATGPLLSAAVLVVGLLATALTALSLHSAQRDAAVQEMNRRHGNALAAIRTEIQRHRGLIETLAAGLAGDDDLTWEDFDNASGPLADAGLPGAAPVAFVVAVPTSELRRAQRLWHDRGALGLTFRPAPDAGEHFLSVFVRTLGDNEQGTRSGTDAAAAEPLATTLREARDTHRLTVSEAYVLGHDGRGPDAGPQYAVTFAAPVWTRENTPRFRGWVCSGLRGGTFLDALRGRLGPISGELILAGAGQTRHTLAVWDGAGDRDLSRTGVVEAGPGQNWILQTHGDSRRLTGTGFYLPVVALGGGLALTALLAWLVQVLATSRSRTQAGAVPGDLLGAGAAGGRSSVSRCAGDPIPLQPEGWSPHGGIR